MLNTLECPVCKKDINWRDDSTGEVGMHVACYESLCKKKSTMLRTFWIPWALALICSAWILINLSCTREKNVYLPAPPMAVDVDTLGRHTPVSEELE